MKEMSTIYIVDTEPITTRYTAQWKEYLPKQIREATGKPVEVISGGETPQATTPGAFLNFGGTNVYKSDQLKKIAEMFCNGEVKNGDYFLYTDAWNPTVIQLRYMAELLGFNIKIGGLWHAGSWDSADFLGRLIGDANWVRHSEKGMFHAYDNNFFASHFHINMFLEEMRDKNINESNEHIVRTGWPFEYLKGILYPYQGTSKKNQVVFPHRIAPEKQVEIFRDLAKSMPEYDFVVCQDQELSKEEYHQILAESKIIFSANLQETLGIGWYEGVKVGAIPMVPNRLSYKEMAMNIFRYPSVWTESFDYYERNKNNLIGQIREFVEDYDKFKYSLSQQENFLDQQYFNGNMIYEVIKDETS